MANGMYWPNSENWQRYWLSGIITFIATIQLIMSFAIVIIQSAIVAIGIGALCYGITARYIMGFVCWCFFFACWISNFCVTCCNRSSVGCATYVLIKNILAFVFSAVLIDFDRKFIDNPYFDYTINNNYLSGIECITNNYNSDTDFLSISLSLTKGQLAAAVLILVSSLVYVGIYIYTYIRALHDDRRISSNVFSSHVQHLSPGSKQPNVIIVEPQRYTAEQPTGPNPAQSRFHENSQMIVCPSCRTTFSIPDRF